MSKLEKAICHLSTLEQRIEENGYLHRVDARVQMLVLLVFLFSMLSLPTGHWQRMAFFLVFPLTLCLQAKLGYFSMFLRSLVVLPFVGLVGIFNPWTSFLGILIRGIASVQAVLVFIEVVGFYNLCRAMQRLGVPSLMVAQLLFVYRYLFVLLQEALSMERARQSRSYGRTTYSLRQWGTFAGQLLLRTLDRSERLHQAMLSRGFNGMLPHRELSPWRFSDTLYLLVWSTLFLLLRFITF